MSFAEQVMAFAGAKRIVAPFGAALASSVFCDPRVQTCVIRTKNTPEFDRIYQWLGLGLSFVAVSDAEADIEGLERFLTVAVKSDAG